MISSTSSVGCDSSRNLLRQLLHRITTLILTIAAATFSIDSDKNGICAEVRSVPNIVLILADDKYWKSAREAVKPSESAGKRRI